MKTAIKDLCVRLGRFVSPLWIHDVNGVLNYLSVGWWMHHHGFDRSQRCARREELYAAVAAPLAEVPVTYLEFGVFQGESVRCWSRLLRHKGARFYGFDSFEGLPESWVVNREKGTFSLDGNLPAIDEPRLSLIKGWFSDTLGPFLRGFAPSEQLVVHLDADLYSSTSFVLRELRPLLVPGTVLLFDELFDRQHELKALDEFLGETGVKLECLGATVGFQQAAFRVC